MSPLILPCRSLYFPFVPLTRHNRGSLYSQIFLLSHQFKVFHLFILFLIFHTSLFRCSSRGQWSSSDYRHVTPPSLQVPLSLVPTVKDVESILPFLSYTLNPSFSVIFPYNFSLSLQISSFPAHLRPLFSKIFHPNPLSDPVFSL